jgi:hypothetical protein
MTIGTSAGNLDFYRGARMSTDDSYWLIPFDPVNNVDYKGTPNTNSYVGLISIVTDTGATNFVNVYTPATQFVAIPVDGDVSPDNIRYYYLLKETAVTKFGGILVVRIADGTVVRYIRFGDKLVQPIGLVASKMDRLAFNSITTKTTPTNSVYFYDSTLTSTNNVVIAHWDSWLNELKCPNFAWD